MTARRLPCWLVHTPDRRRVSRDSYPRQPLPGNGAQAGDPPWQRNEHRAPTPGHIRPLTVIHLRHEHPDHVLYIDVTLTDNEGRWLATAMLDKPDIGRGRIPGKR